jgi:thioesterase domain-containing protein
MHAAGANVLFYRDLSLHLGLDQPVYGIQAREQESTQTYLNRVEDMAAHYLMEILTFQPQGPYYLCGSSFGGLVAYEAAQQLKAKGLEIALLALFDTYGPGYPQLLQSSNPLGHKFDRTVDRYTALKRQLREMKSHEKAQFIKAKARKAFVNVKRRWLYKKNEFQIKYNQATGRELPKDMQRNNKALRQALNTYIPKPYDGQLTVFRASMQPKGIVLNPSLGWESLAARIDIYESAGSHGAMTVDPFAKPLAEQLLPCLMNKNGAIEMTRQQLAAATDLAISTRKPHADFAAGF